MKFDLKSDASIERARKIVLGMCGAITAVYAVGAILFLKYAIGLALQVACA